ncbi:hypothetical protein L2719_07970 [Shewanella schlegeliana]|uniref:Uncharacterized protein n=1 Tax=Shewanella schlegeliana TaxID=190308 RepID=A0ABS1T0I5_9GAMM|nr:hypothetical protein [Shewanella schlegeliana]MBL4914298.1 hypothetical protein [Shewanella schlegeliana]MCL1109479.1 hypothetical protein [Shewanella schlegeliana]GIU33526.1 hypothetical protein TUM4433_28090 [Shewanella schlegeliana]
MKQKIVLVKSYFAKIKTDMREEMWAAKPKTSDFEYSTCKIDSDRLNADLQQALETLNQDGYKVVQITPVTSGDFAFKDHFSDPHLLGNGVTTEGGYGYGFSYTDSLIILAELIAEAPKQQVANESLDSPILDTNIPTDELS